MSVTINEQSAVWIDNAGNRHDYKIVNGTAYDLQTAKEVVEVLEACRANKTRIAIHYGDDLTGKAWGDVECGRVGRSTGNLKAPLILNNRRSSGGPAILDRCIVKIETTAGGRVLYQHPFYQKSE